MNPQRSQKPEPVDPMLVEWLRQLVTDGIGFDLDGDVMVPLDGTAHLPHAVLAVGGVPTELGRLVCRAVLLGTLPAEGIPCRQVVAVLRRISWLGGTHALLRQTVDSKRAVEGRGSVGIEWRGEAPRPEPAADPEPEWIPKRIEPGET